MATFGAKCTCETNASPLLSLDKSRNSAWMINSWFPWKQIISACQNHSIPPLDRPNFPMYNKVVNGSDRMRECPGQGATDQQTAFLHRVWESITSHGPGGVGTFPWVDMPSQALTYFEYWLLVLDNFDAAFDEIEQSYEDYNVLTNHSIATPGDRALWPQFQRPLAALQKVMKNEIARQVLKGTHMCQPRKTTFWSHLRSALAFIIPVRDQLLCGAWPDELIANISDILYLNETHETLSRLFGWDHDMYLVRFNHNYSVEVNFSSAFTMAMARCNPTVCTYVQLDSWWSESGPLLSAATAMVTLNRTFVFILFGILTTVCWLNSDGFKTACQQAWTSTTSSLLQRGGQMACLPALGRPLARCAANIQQTYRSWKRSRDEHLLYNDINHARDMRDGTSDEVDGIEMAEGGNARGLVQ
jgi:hypothetical protein